MSCVTTRISLQWKPDPPSEYTDTLVLTASSLHFVDLRLKTPLPEDGQGDESMIDWIITGVEHPIEGTSKVEFRHDINSHLPGNSGLPYDIGEFFDLENGDKSEGGSMINWNSGVEQEFEEIWRLVDPIKSRPGEYVQDKDAVVAGQSPTVAFHVDEGNYLGKSVRIGNFAQGALLNRAEDKVSCVRWFKDQDGWRVVFQCGAEVGKIPLGEDECVKDVESVKWTVVESTFV